MFTLFIDGARLIYGDMLVHPGDELLLGLSQPTPVQSSSKSKSSAKHMATKKHAVKATSKKWPDGVVPYSFNTTHVRTYH